MSHSVTIKNVVKRYGDFTAINGISLDIKEGEFFTLLGPSGCGKTTLLRMIAGFNTIEEGEIYFGDKCINYIPAHKRGIGMVFQNYAIFPHLTVAENVAYGLKAKKVPANEIPGKVIEALKMVQIDNLADRKPSQLSGGQQQRVALARAIVIEPDVLLMDEPLSNLDAKLRVQMRGTIKKLQRRLGITTIYVTHDQEEALAVSDRIAVIDHGIIMQVGKPQEVYSKAQNQFVSNFIGVSNFIPCHIKTDAKNVGTISVSGELDTQAQLRKSFEGDAIVAARPEQLFFSEKGMPGTISFSTFLGDFILYEILLDNGQMLQLNEYTKDTQVIRPDNQKVHISFRSDQVNIYTQDGKEVLSC